MSKDRARAVTDLRYYQNRTKKGNPTATPAKQGMNYYTFEQGDIPTKTQERGTWYNPNGEEVEVPEMTEWVKGNAAENKYTYTAVLSVRDGEMNEQDFIKAMNEQDEFSDYRLIIHKDTDHDHAHVMMFRDKTLKKSEFYSWRKSVGSELENAESRQLDRAEREATERESWDIGDGSDYTIGENDLDNYSFEEEAQRVVQQPKLRKPKLPQLERDDDEFEMDR